jgi:hypothetical protein
MAVSFTIPPVDANDDEVAWKDETVGSDVETNCVEAPAIIAGVARITPLAKKKRLATNRAGADLEKTFKLMNSQSNQRGSVLVFTMLPGTAVEELTLLSNRETHPLNRC